jgi:hypothetical protein
MKNLCIKIIGVALLFPLLVGLGCDRSSAPPTALAVEEFPAAFEKAFSKAKPETKELAKQIVTGVQAKDYSKAFLALQSLLSDATLSKQQMSVTSGALLTVNSLLEAAQAEGNQNAAETIKVYRSTK